MEYIRLYSNKTVFKLNIFRVRGNPLVPKATAKITDNLLGLPSTVIIRGYYKICSLKYNINNLSLQKNPEN